MQILVVTNQLVKEENERFFCIENLFDILERFAQMGTLLLCAQRYAGKSSNVIESDITKLIEPSNIHYVKKTYLRTNSSSRRVIENCVKQADLIIGYVPNINATTACLLAKKYHKKYMSYVVGCVWDALWNHGLFGKVLAPYNFFNTRWCLKNSDYALYVTEHFLQRRYPCKGITCGCSDVKIESLDENVLQNRLKKIASLNESSVLNIVTIANNSVRYKGQHFVIKALAKLKQSGVTKFHYHLIGGGDKTWLENLSKKLGVSDFVHFDGIVPHSEILDRLDGMDIYIQPSLQEGLPRAVVEAMSRGLLCICANTAAMPEIVETGYIVERKSVQDIEHLLIRISLEDLKKQAKRNFAESKKFNEVVLNEKRNVFFKKVNF